MRCYWVEKVTDDNDVIMCGVDVWYSAVTHCMRCCHNEVNRQ